MLILKIITTTLIVSFMLLILFFLRGLTWKKNDASIIGFEIMELIYLLSLICIWGG